jgi:hypothetical protein
VIQRKTEVKEGGEDVVAMSVAFEAAAATYIQ